MIGRARPLPLRLRLAAALCLALVFAALSGRAGIALADEAPIVQPLDWADDDLRFRGTAQVAVVEPGGSLLTTDGRRLRLAGIALPLRPLSLPADQGWPIAAKAEAALTALAAGQTLRLYQAGRWQDRYGRLLVQAAREDGTWLQGSLLRQGLARVETTPDSQRPLQAMRTAESAARRGGFGLWALPAYRVRRPAEADAWVDSVQLVEGRVTAVRRGKDGLRLAFGGNRRHAFSVHVPFAVWTEWARMPTLKGEPETAARASLPWASDPSALIGQRLRVRGWIGKGRTAEIAVSHAGQIEWIAPTRARRWTTAKRTRQENAGRVSEEN